MIGIIFAILALFLPLSTVFAQQALTISGITDNQASFANGVPTYEKLEITFQIQNSTATNLQFPFDPSPPAGIPNGTGITVTGEFLPPGQTNWSGALSQPAFYYQDFLWEQRNNKDWAYPSGNYAWKLRFAPHVAGTWQYRITARDSSGTITSQPSSFTVTSSTNKGFIKVSRTDSRYFEYDDGTYFPGLGYNIRPNMDDIEANNAMFSTMGANGIQLNRMWLSSWSIFGSAWNPWNAMPQDYDAYLPRTGLEAVDGAFRLKLSMRTSNPNIPDCSGNCSYWKASRFLGWMSPQVAVKPQTNYRIRVRYRGQNITALNPALPYGVVAKMSTTWLNAPHTAGTGTIVTDYGGNTTNWTELSRTTRWNSGTSNFLPYFYITLENVNDPGAGNPAAVAYIDHVAIEEDLGNGTFGPNIVYKPTMDQQTYFDQRNSYAFDRLLELAKENNIYLRPVLLEKNEYIQNHIDQAGVLRTDDLSGLFYGSGPTQSAVRWYQKAYFRYAQARWGYSPNIHSWELLNEGDPGDTDHFYLTNELGRFMHCEVFGIPVSSESRCDASTSHPNAHLVSTSNWHSFPKDAFWANPNFPYVDFADVHYYQTEAATEELADTALATLNRSMAYGAKQPGGAMKPVIRGETGFVTTGSEPSIRAFDADTRGIWLHKFLWGQLNSGGLLESYWYTGGPDGHIYNSATGIDHRPLFGRFFRFIKDIPLSNGAYIDAGATSPHVSLRVIGQKDLAHGKAHLWIQNINHTWQQDIAQIAVAPITSTVELPGLLPDALYHVQWWDTYTGQPTTSQEITTSSGGTLTLPVTNLTADIAVQITRDTGTTVRNSDLDLDGDTDIVDLLQLVSVFGREGTAGFIRPDIHQDGSINIFDVSILISQFGT